MKFLELSALVAFLCNLTLTVLVLSRDQRSTVNRVYFVWGLAVTIWNLGAYFLFKVDDVASALFWAYVLQFGVILIPISNFHLSLLIAQVSIGRWLPLLYALYGGLIVSLFTGHFISGVERLHFAWYSVRGPAFSVFIVSYSILASSTMFMLYRKQRHLPPLHRTRLRSLLLAYSLLLIFGTNDLLPIVGVKEYPFTKIPVPPIGSTAAIFYGIIVGYSVLQHQLLDIHVTLSKVAARVVRLLFLFLVGLSFLLLIYLVAPGEQFTLFAFFSCLAVLLASAIISSVFFPRLYGTGDDKLERRILGDRFEYHAKVQGFTQRMYTFSDSTLLLDELHKLLVKTVQVRSYQIVLLDEKTRRFSLYRSYPSPTPTQIPVQLPDLHLDSPIFQLFQQTRQDYLTFNIAYSMPGGTNLEQEARKQLRQFDPEFCFPLFSAEDPFGLFLIGAKANGEPYTPHDLHLLTDLVKNLSLLLNQIRLKDQIQIAQEMDLLGMMSRGMAHDLNNLLTPAWTYLQVCHTGPPDPETNSELLPIAIRNVETMRAYIKEALFFSHTQAPQLVQKPLEDIVRAAIELTQPECKRKNIIVSLNAESSLVVEIDEVLVQRLICNLLSNANDASHPGSQIQVEAFRLTKTERTRYWVRLRIIDQGEGISPENLKRIFTPYFTTKDRHDDRRGFGLGLAICRKIVHLHGGNLNVASELKKGTIVQVDLPSRQINNHGASPTKGNPIPTSSPP